MENYYIFDGKEQKGPFTLNELKLEKIQLNTLFWTQGMNEWDRFENNLDLWRLLKNSNDPPSIPNNLITATKIPKIANKVKVFFISWISFHLFALIMSQSGVKLFGSGDPESEHFWPIVDFVDSWKIYENKPREYRFNGLFLDYDKSEFLVYIGVALFIITLSYILKSKDLNSK